MTFTISYAGVKIPVNYIKTSDGDTARFKINGEEKRVRFLGINTPEVAGEDKIEQALGNEAMEFTKNLLENANKIEIEYDDVADKEDRYGRILAWVWVDGKLAEEELLNVGLAKTYMLKKDYNYTKRLNDAEKNAREKGLGIWSEEGLSDFSPTSGASNFVSDEDDYIDEKIDAETKTENINFEDINDESNKIEGVNNESFNIENKTEEKLESSSSLFIIICAIIATFICIYMKKKK